MEGIMVKHYDNGAVNDVVVAAVVVSAAVAAVAADVDADSSNFDSDFGFVGGTCLLHIYLSLC